MDPLNDFKKKAKIVARDFGLYGYQAELVVAQVAMP